MKKKTKEQIYDEQISPLMTQIIEICKRHKIAHVCSFSLDFDEGLCCTTCSTTDECEPPEKFKDCVRRLYGEDSRPLTMLTVRDGNGKITKMEAIV